MGFACRQASGSRRSESEPCEGSRHARCAHRSRRSLPARGYEGPSELPRRSIRPHGTRLVGEGNTAQPCSKMDKLEDREPRPVPEVPQLEHLFPFCLSKTEGRPFRNHAYMCLMGEAEQCCFPLLNRRLSLA